MGGRSPLARLHATIECPFHCGWFGILLGMAKFSIVQRLPCKAFYVESTFIIPFSHIDFHAQHVHRLYFLSPFSLSSTFYKPFYLSTPPSSKFETSRRTLSRMILHKLPDRNLSSPAFILFSEQAPPLPAIVFSTSA